MVKNAAPKTLYSKTGKRAVYKLNNLTGNLNEINRALVGYKLGVKPKSG